MSFHNSLGGSDFGSVLVCNQGFGGQFHRSCQFCDNKYNVYDEYVSKTLIEHKRL